jgi:hydroxylamine reductase
MVLGYEDNEINEFFYKALAGIGKLSSADELLPLVFEVGKINLQCMELLDRANTEVYGIPKLLLFL